MLVVACVVIAALLCVVALLIVIVVHLCREQGQLEADYLDLSGHIARLQAVATEQNELIGRQNMELAVAEVVLKQHARR